MTQESDLHKQIKRGKDAEKVLNNPLIAEALEGMRESMHSGWARSGFNDKNGRNECYIMLRAIDSFDAQLKCWVTNGKAAETTLEKLGKKLKKLIPMR